MYLYTATDIIRRYAGRVALYVPSLAVQHGTVWALVGPNGSGKSTLLRILAFLESPDAGTLHFNGTHGVAQRLEATLLLQEPYLLKRSVAHNVAYGLHVRGCTDNMEARVREALEMVGFVPNDIMRRSWQALSGGERQRVALAARLIVRPKALLLDEPTSNLDTRSSEIIREAIHIAIAQGSTVLIASHDHAWLKTLHAQTVRLPA